MKILYDRPTILDRVDEIAKSINKNYAGETLHVVVVSTGGMMFAADLLLRLTPSIRLHLIGVKSYHGMLRTEPHIEYVTENIVNIKDSPVLIIDDILDSGKTIQTVTNYLKEFNPASIEVAVILDKPSKRLTSIEVIPHYKGFEVGDYFVVGYGCDFRGEYRNLPFIGVLDDGEVDKR